MKNWKKKRERERKRYIKELLFRKDNSQSLYSRCGREERVPTDAL